jgi:FKBP-type peptidyl-prolyl cis-trans isomerase
MSLSKETIMRVVAALLVMLLPAFAYAAQEPAHPSPDPAEAALKSKREGEAFLAANKTKPDVVTLASGLQYKILKVGTGRKPTPNETVICHFRGTTIDGTAFGDSFATKRPAVFQVKKVNKGWAEALQLMPAGSKWQLYIPADLAYGERGVKGLVPPNATVIYDVELVAINSVEAERAKDLSAGAKGLRIGFKLDPRTTQGLYMGERWVSPPKYNSALAGKSVNVEARAAALDAKGRPRQVIATWAAADPKYVTVTAKGRTATFTVNGEGESTVNVGAEGLSMVLTVKSAYVGKTLQVEITQPVAQP